MATKQKAARSTAVAWRRALKAIGVDMKGVRVLTVYLRSCAGKEPLHKLAFPPESQTATVVDRAKEFTSLVAAGGFCAHVILRAGNADTGLPPYIEITNDYRPSIRQADTMLATTETDD